MIGGKAWINRIDGPCLSEYSGQQSRNGLIRSAESGAVNHISDGQRPIGKHGVQSHLIDPKEDADRNEAPDPSGQIRDRRSLNGFRIDGEIGSLSRHYRVGDADLMRIDRLIFSQIGARRRLRIVWGEPLPTDWEAVIGCPAETKISAADA